MIILYIILGIFIYLTIGTVVINLLNRIKLISDNDIKYEFGTYVFFFPLPLIYLSAIAFGKLISKLIYDKYRKYKYDKSIKFYVDKADKRP